MVASIAILALRAARLSTPASRTIFYFIDSNRSDWTDKIFLPIITPRERNGIIPDETLYSRYSQLSESANSCSHYNASSPNRQQFYYTNIRFSIFSVARIAAASWSLSTPTVIRGRSFSRSQAMRVSTKASVLPPGGIRTS